MKIAFFYPLSCYVQSTIMFFFVLRGEAKNLWEKWHNSEIMFHLELGIQSKQGWQFLYDCQNAIEKKLFNHLHIPFFPHVLHVYSHSKMFSEKFLAFPLIKDQQIYFL